LLRCSTGTILGVDFGAPRYERDQRKKIVAIEAERYGDRLYRVRRSGTNERLVVSSEPPGWSAKELLAELLRRPVRVAAFDFPFSAPAALLCDDGFTRAVGERERLMGWRAFAWAIERRLPLNDPLDFSAFSAWRSKNLWKKRATDEAAVAHPPLKDRFQAIFQMTLLGNHILSKLWDSHLYRVVPFGGSNQENEAIEVYPGATLRILGMRGYKREPAEAIDRVLGFARANDVTIDVDPSILDFCCRYSSGRDGSPDHDGADAFVALATAIFYCEGLCRTLMPADADRWVSQVEGGIWAPRIAERTVTRRAR
jgi:hypothetical protein